MLKSSLVTALLAFSGLMAQAQTTSQTPATPAAPATPAPEVKQSKTGICHDQSSKGYKQLNKFTEFKSMDDCIKGGARAAKK